MRRDPEYLRKILFEMEDSETEVIVIQLLKKS